MNGQETWNSEWFDLEEVDLKLCLQDLNPQIFHGIKEPREAKREFDQHMG